MASPERRGSQPQSGRYGRAARASREQSPAVPGSDSLPRRGLAPEERGRPALNR